MKKKFDDKGFVESDEEEKIEESTFLVLKIEKVVGVRVCKKINASPMLESNDMCTSQEIDGDRIFF